MLEIRAIMDSAVEDVFGFKTCCGMRAFDQNLEVRITNKGTRTLRVPSVMELETRDGTVRIDHLMPHGIRAIEPGETAAFYCTMEASLWAGVRGLVVYDTDGRSYRCDHPDDSADRS